MIGAPNGKWNWVKKLIDKKGSTLSLIEVQHGEFDTDTGEDIITEIPHVIRGHVSPYSTSDLVDGVVLMGDMRVLIYASSFNITKKWEIEFDGMRYKIINISKITTDDQQITYTLQCRGY